MTTARRALEAAAKGEPTALRQAVEALGDVLELLGDQADDGTLASDGAGVWPAPRRF